MFIGIIEDPVEDLHKIFKNPFQGPQYSCQGL